MRIALTTSDNPYSPFDQWDEWYAYDMSHGYHTCELLDRLSYCASGISENDNLKAIEEAIDIAVNEIPLLSTVDGAFYVKAIEGLTKFPIII